MDREGGSEKWFENREQLTATSKVLEEVASSKGVKLVDLSQVASIMFGLCAFSVITYVYLCLRYDIFRSCNL